MFGSNNSRRLKPEELHVNKLAQPDWSTGNENQLAAGDIVLCTEGLAQILKVRGKTGDGSRLLELRLVEGDQHPFYAAASNVLMKPRVEAEVGD
jgi:hypothetical protein